MTTGIPIIDCLAARVHDSYVAAKRAQGATSVPSRYGTGELLRPYNELDERDKEDDRRTVRTVLAGLAQMPLREVLALRRDIADEVLLAELADAARVCDPVPEGLVARCTQPAREAGKGMAPEVSP